MSRDEREWREDVIIDEYGEYIRGVCVYDMPDEQIYCISERILRKREREYNTPKESAIVEPSPYYYNKYGQLCVINDSGTEEVVEC